ncbi:hypothetical protein PDESU_02086 [Pontiella desulfatans]|uniref:Sialate O-acetylesterase domain-containing protein n=1 Tax=Pontiella desulfatans TaxID=2750659 RepID=A0A6C2U146_PONDE|nr:sialate O-acetylesterase [Pontiella desulfatans]VGO13529.1 hypothetical protein PDESU_02086 [Pontiella desulfatans]
MMIREIVAEKVERASRSFKQAGRLLYILNLCALGTFAELSTGSLFTDNMVLQRDKPIIVWGTAESGEKVTVQFADQTKSGVASATGKWKITLDPMPASSKPRKLQVSGFKSQVSFADVLVGEVWFAGGQSNMRWALWNTDGAAELFESGGAEIDGLHLFAMSEIVNELDADLPIKGWQKCTKESSTAFSAVTWYFGRALKERFKDVPVGLIMSARGGTPAEAWMDSDFAAGCKPFTEYAAWCDAAYQEKYAGFDEYKAAYIQYKEDWKAFVHKKSPEKPVEPMGPYHAHRAGGLYGTMIAPILPYSVRGVLWYQGESNMWRAYDYRFVLKTLIGNWRRDFEDPSLPFLVVQLPGFGCGGAEHPIWAVVRDSQVTVAAGDANVGTIPIPELGDEKDIHPRNKRPVGERIARYARGAVYGDNIQFAGPSFESVEFAAGKAIVSLKDTKGLKQKGDAIRGFSIAGSDELFVSATAELKKGKLVISSPEVKEPVAVRYLWSNWINPTDVTLFNGAGLPLAPFRSDDWKVVTQK